jgi:hypothetical protein
MTERCAATASPTRQPTPADAWQLPTEEEAVVDARRSQRLFDPLFTTEAMRAIFSDHGRVQAMLDF